MFLFFQLLKYGLFGIGIAFLQRMGRGSFGLLILSFFLPAAVHATVLDVCHVILERASHLAPGPWARTITIVGGKRFKKFHLIFKANSTIQKLVFEGDGEFNEMLLPENFGYVRSAYQLKGSDQILFIGYTDSKRNEDNHHFIAVLPEKLDRPMEKIFSGNKLVFVQSGSQMIVRSTSTNPEPDDFYIPRLKGNKIQLKRLALQEGVGIVPARGRKSDWIYSSFFLNTNDGLVSFLHPNGEVENRSLPVRVEGEFVLHGSEDHRIYLPSYLRKSGISLAFVDARNGDLKPVKIRYEKTNPSDSLSVDKVKSVGKKIFVRVIVRSSRKGQPFNTYVWMKLFRGKNSQSAKLKAVTPLLPPSVYDWGSDIGLLFYKQMPNAALKVEDGYPVYLVSSDSGKPMELYLPEASVLLPHGFFVSKTPSGYRLHRIQGEKLKHVLNLKDNDAEVFQLSAQDYFLRSRQENNWVLYYFSNLEGRKPLPLLETQDRQEVLRKEVVDLPDGKKLVFFQTKASHQSRFDYKYYLWIISADGSRATKLSEHSTSNEFDGYDNSYHFIPNSPLFWTVIKPRSKDQRYEFYRATENGLEPVILENLDLQKKIFSVTVEGGKIRILHESGISVYMLPNSFE